MNKKTVTFGEIMLRLSTPGHQRFTQAASFEATYGGGEANVAASLAGFGFDSYFVTRLPDNDIGRAARAHLARYGVNADCVIEGGDRLGIYFLESGASQRPSRVIYDRARSAVSEIEPGMVNWEEVFDGCELFHFTGITPALSDSAAEVCLQAATAAKKAGITVSCDLNFRKKLWTQEKAREVMGKLVPLVDIVVANEEDAQKTFGIKAEGVDVSSAEMERGKYEPVARELRDRFDLKMVAITLRRSISASDNEWSGMLFQGEDYHYSRVYPVHIVDRVGGGDAFAAGLICAYLDGRPPAEIVEFAAAASCLKHTVPGDFNIVTRDEVENLLRGDASGRIQR